MPSSSAAFSLEHVGCNLCGEDDPETIYEARYEAGAGPDLIRTFRASGDGLLVDRLVRCRRCALEYVSPRPAGAAIVDAYSEGHDLIYVSQVDAREATFSEALRRIETLHGGTGRLLDIGTAAGAFLAAAQKRGWNAEGCEPNRWMAEWGSSRYGVTIRPGELFDQEYPRGTFDVVTLWDVIEHTPDPSRVAARCAELLKPHGLLIVNYPDIGSWIARALGKRWPFLSSVHLYYFTRETMGHFLEKHGFEVIDVRPHIQRLQFDYLLSRGEIVSPAISRVSRAVGKVLRLSGRQVPYWIGQTFVAARLKP